MGLPLYLFPAFAAGSHRAGRRAKDPGFRDHRVESLVVTNGKVTGCRGAMEGSGQEFEASGESVVIDPSVTVVARGGAPVPVDAVINSHSHEDHMAGNGLFAGARLHIHDEDLPGARSMDGLMEVYGLTSTAFSEVLTYFPIAYLPLRPSASDKIA